MRRMPVTDEGLIVSLAIAPDTQSEKKQQSRHEV